MKRSSKKTDGSHSSGVEQVDWENLHFWERGYQELKGSKLAPFFGDWEMPKRGMEIMTDMMLSNGLIAMAEPSFPTDIEVAGVVYKGRLIERSTVR